MSRIKKLVRENYSFVWKSQGKWILQSSRNPVNHIKSNPKTGTHKSNHRLFSSQWVSSILQLHATNITMHWFQRLLEAKKPVICCSCQSHAAIVWSPVVQNHRSKCRSCCTSLTAVTKHIGGFHNTVIQKKLQILNTWSKPLLTCICKPWYRLHHMAAYITVILRTIHMYTYFASTGMLSSISQIKSCHAHNCTELSLHVSTLCTLLHSNKYKLA